MENSVNTAAAPTPSEILAEQIFQNLLAEGLIAEEDKTNFVKKMARGELRDSDWSVLLGQVLHTKTSDHETAQT